MKNSRTVRLVLVVAFLAAAGSLVLWRTVGSGVPIAAVAEERQNQERMRNEMPRPNESAPSRAGAADSPR